MGYEPFRLTLTLRTPMVEPTMFKPMDGVLSWAAVQRAQYDDLADPVGEQHNLPLERHASGDEWCFKISNIEFDWIGQLGSTCYFRRQTVREYADAWMNGVLKKASRIDTTKGKFKAGVFVQTLRAVSEARAWGVGNIAALEALMPYVTHLGKLHHRDHGAVASWRVERDASALSRWARRPLPKTSPFADADTYAPSIGALRAPYWLRAEHTEVMMPA